MKTFATWMMVLVVAIAVGCTKPEEEGPAEKAGKQVDQAIENAKEYTGEKMEEMGESMENEGEEMQKEE